MVNKILSCSAEYPESPISKRLREAIKKHRNEPTYQTRSEIKSLAFEHFTGRTTQHELLSSSRPRADSNAGVNIKQGPADKVFRTPELLEVILSNLSAIELVKASGVSKSFWAVMKTSPIIQSKLFLRPVEPMTTIEMSVSPVGSSTGSLKPHEYVVVEPSPLLQVKDPWVCPLAERLPPQYRGDTASLNARVINAPFWTNMYLTNPPCTEADIRFSYSSFHPTSRTPHARHYRITAWHHIHRENGITFGTLMEAACLEGGIEIEEHGSLHGRPSWNWFTKDSVADQVMKCENEGQCCKLQLDPLNTEVHPVGIALSSENYLERWERWAQETTQHSMREWPDEKLVVKVKHGKPVGETAKCAVSCKSPSNFVPPA